MIELKGINRVFQVGDESVYALNDVSLHIDAGDYISIMGPSGSGKSTLLNILGLLDRPNSGQYLFENVDISSFSDEQQALTRSEKIGFVFQVFHLIPRLTAAQNIELPLILAGVDPVERKHRVEKILKSTGLVDRAHHKPGQLSGGQRQRVAMARATIMNPSIILADEPTGNLDRASGKEIVDVLEHLNKEGMTLIIVTHDPELGQRARRQIRMIDGQIEATSHNEVG